MDFERDPRLVKGSQGRVALYRADKVDAERLCLILQRVNARRAVEREPVLGPGHARSAICYLVNDYNTSDRTGRLDSRSRQPMPGLSPQPAPTLRKMTATRFRRLLPPRQLAYSKTEALIAV